MRLTLAKAKPAIARVLGVSTSDPMVVDMINEATQRLMTRGDWRNTVVRYRICTHHAKLTWPRQIETILRANVNSAPITIANKWYEFAQGGPGTLSDDGAPGLVLEDMGEACAFDDIIGLDKLLAVKSSEAEDANARILLQGYDDTNNWVRTHDALTGELVNGEYVSIGPNYSYTTTKFASLTGAIKPITNGTVLIQEYHAGTGSRKPLALYEPDEELPMYRRSRVPMLESVGGGCDTCVDGQAVLNVLAKMRFIPVREDTDYVLITNLPALKDMVMAIDKAEKHMMADAEYYESRAVRELASELKNHEGGAIPQYDVQEPATFGVGHLEGVI
jgi:hypothetical protein